jgi:hypothetical protein
MFRQINCHPQGVFIKDLQVLIAFKYTIGGFTHIVEVLTPLIVSGVNISTIKAPIVYLNAISA